MNEELTALDVAALQVFFDAVGRLDDLGFSIRVEGDALRLLHEDYPSGRFVKPMGEPAFMWVFEPYQGVSA